MKRTIFILLVIFVSTLLPQKRYPIVAGCEIFGGVINKQFSSREEFAEYCKKEREYSLFGLKGYVGKTRASFDINEGIWRLESISYDLTGIGNCDFDPMPKKMAFQDVNQKLYQDVVKKVLNSNFYTYD